MLERVHGLVRLVREQEFPDGTLTLRYGFVHVLYQNALYASLRPTRKATWSAAAAERRAPVTGKQSGGGRPSAALGGGQGLACAADAFQLAAENAVRRSLARRPCSWPGEGWHCCRSCRRPPPATGKSCGCNAPCAWRARGYAAAEVGQTYSRVCELSLQLGQAGLVAASAARAVGLSSQSGSWTRCVAEQSLAQAPQGPDVQTVWHAALTTTLIHQGEHLSGLEHQEKCQARALGGPTAYSRSFAAWCSGRWARSIGVAAHPPAHRRAAAPRDSAEADVGFVAAFLHQFRRDAPRTRELSGFLIDLCRDQELSGYLGWAWPAAAGRLASRAGLPRDWRACARGWLPTGPRNRRRPAPDARHAGRGPGDGRAGADGALRPWR